MENPANRENTGRNPDGTFIAGVSGNPSGRPKGTLKEYVSRKFREMSDEEKEQWLAEHKIAGEVQWKMGEGNPTSELTGKDGKDLIPEDSPRIKELTEKLNATLHGSGSGPSNGEVTSPLGTEAPTKE